MQNHTPGPWITETSANLVQLTDSATEGKCIALIHLPPHENRGQSGIRCEYQANARLIAAAPELLAALQALLASAEAAGWHKDNSNMRAARSALSKASPL
jgi:hypothetical protein